MDDSMNVLKGDYLPDDLEPELVQTGVTGTVLVQARQNLEETGWLLELANKHAFIKGVVGWLDLCSPGLYKQLEKFTAHPNLVGLRHVLQDESDDDYMLRPDFMNGIAQLEACGLTYDLLLFPRHLLRAVEREARERGCAKLTLEVLEGNAPARGAYEKFGFGAYQLDPAMGQAMFWQKSL